MNTIFMRYLCVPILLVSSLIQAQKYDNNWIEGNFNDGTFNSNVSVIRLNFFDNYLNSFVESNIKGNFLDSGNAISDPETGEMIFYTNGVTIFRPDGTIMPNGFPINVQQYIDIQGESPFRMAIIPSPKKENEYWMFHFRKPEGENLPQELYRYRVDMNEDNGKGVVTEKKIIFKNPKGIGNFAFSKHGNGRDWWMAIPTFPPIVFQKFLITPDSIYGPVLQDIGEHPPIVSGGGGSGPFGRQFSHDGKWFVDNHFGQVINFFHFDRCSGGFSLAETVHVDSVTGCCGGAIFSPNNKYCYVSINRSIFQFDVTAPNIAASKQFCYRAYDPVTMLDSLFMYTLQLGLDGRVYGEGALSLKANPQGTAYYNCQSGIYYPNKRGPACGASVKMFFLPKHGGYPPYHPNYRLGPLDGSACDTLGIDNHPLAGFRWDLNSAINHRSIEFTDNSWYEPATWSWDFDGLGTSADTNPTFIFPNDGVFKVCLTVCNQYSCDSVCHLVSIGTVATSESTNSKVQLLLSPNPASDQFQIELQKKDHKNPENQTLQFTNLLGQPIFKTNFSTEKITIETADWPPGAYMVQLFENGILKTSEKLIVVH